MNIVLIYLATLRNSLRLLAGAALLTLLCAFASQPSALAGMVRAGAGLFSR